jgi:hypothetical protein
MSNLANLLNRQLIQRKIEKQRQQDMANQAAINKLQQEYREQHIDSDLDGISDAEEYTIGTNPRSADSDWDGLSDLEEISLSSNPRMYDEQYSDCPDAERQREI